MNGEPTQIEFKWPWTMMPLECADEWIEFIRNRIGPGHPLYEKEFLPSARREDQDVILVENDGDGTYALLHLGRTMTIRRERMLFIELNVPPGSWFHVAVPGRAGTQLWTSSARGTDFLGRGRES